MVVPRLAIDLHTSGPVQLSVLDNLIVTHNLSQQVSMLFDVKLRGSPPETRISFPIVAPLPITPISQTGEVLTNQLYDDDWKFFLPGYVLSEKERKAWKLQLNLRSICASFSDRVRLVDFLIRREHSQELLLENLRSALLEHESLTALAAIFDLINRVLATHQQLAKKTEDPKISQSNLESDLTTKKTATFWRTFLRQQREESPVSTPPTSPTPTPSDDSYVEEREAFETVENTVAGEFSSQSMDFDGVTEDDDTSANSTADSEVKENPLSRSRQIARTEGYLVLEQEVIYTDVLVPVEEMNALDSQYLTSVAVEYVRTLNYQHIPVKSFLYEFIIDQLVRNNRFYQLHQFLQYHVIADSLHVACQLLSLETVYPPCYQLALDMLKRLGANDQIVEVLLTKGLVIQALRFYNSSKRLQAQKMHPTRFLDAAKNDSVTFFTVYNYFDSAQLIDESCSEFVTYYNNLCSEPADELRVEASA